MSNPIAKSTDNPIIYKNPADRPKNLIELENHQIGKTKLTSYQCMDGSILITVEEGFSKGYAINFPLGHLAKKALHLCNLKMIDDLYQGD